VQRRDSNSTEVGHEGDITGRDGFSLRSSIANPRGVAQSPLQSTNALSMYLLVCHLMIKRSFSDNVYMQMGSVENAR